MGCISRKGKSPGPGSLPPPLFEFGWPPSFSTCKNCEQVYIEESGRKFGIRLGEHKKDCECNANSAYTRATHKLSEKTMEKSAITDHQNVNNHEIDWEGAKILERENNWRMRKTKEAIRIRTEWAVMNRDQGTFLSGIYDPFFASLRKTG